MRKAKQILVSKAMALSVLFVTGPTQAVDVASLAQVPLFLVQSAEPLVMLNMSNDHQLFYKAYDDWSDIDGNLAGGDPDVETTYKHSIDYYGYFDPYKCYTHNGSYFVPKVITSTKYCTAGNSYWSGNFLNWASMARIDTVRKILYGGYRSTDNDSSTNSGLTVLERAYLPSDAHSFAKYYQESSSGELARLTPWTNSEITICNTTYGTTGDSEDSTQPPLLRVAAGNFALWAANERWQCHWDDNSESQGSRKYTWGSYTEVRMNNGNNPADSGLDAWHSNPSWTGDNNGDSIDDKLGNGDYIARVEVCNSALLGTEKCKVYPEGNTKPIGVLQEYGDDGEFFVGLMTGSFQKNKSGGTLRKNVGTFVDEVNVTTDGTFKTAPAAGGIVDTLNKLRVSGYCYDCSDDGTYNQADNCKWGINTFNDGNCTNWGNPQSEIYLETLRYFAGLSADSTFKANDTSFLPGLNTATTWVDPLSTTNYCAPIEIIQFNASMASYDGDMTGASGLDSISGASDVNAWTDKVGGHENINGNDYFVGSNGTDNNGLCTSKSLTGLSDAVGICPEAPRLEGDYDIAGLAYYANTTSIRTDIKDVDGAAVDIHAETYGVTLAPAVPVIYVVRAGSTDADDIVAAILPACRNESVDGNCAIVDFKVVEKQAETSAGSGLYSAKFYVNWEDSEQGGDYDQDMAGVIEYIVSSTGIRVTTQTIGQSTPNAMGFGYIIAGTTNDGFHVHSGINGFSENVDASGVLTCSDSSLTCNNRGAPTSVTYTLGTNATGLLDDPLLLAAKYGGFEEDDKDINNGGTRPVGATVPNDIPDQDYEWKDTATGLPKNYFFATNPAELENSLGNVFLAASEDTASASSTAANSQRISTDTTIYQARFNPSNWSGELLAYPVIPGTGALSSTPVWEASAKLDDASVTAGTRSIITNVGGSGASFEWANLTTAQKTALNIDPDTSTPDTLGDERVLFLRGDRSCEMQNRDSFSACTTSGASFRDRGSRLGDLVNSSPAYVGAPQFGYPDWLERYEDTSNPSTQTNLSAERYSTFKNDESGRTPMLYVGGNDGMVHGFTALPDATTGGIEKIAFVPNAVYATLNQLTSPDYAHRYYVDGTPTFGDVMFSDNNWHTMLVGGLNGGGRGIYALDVTDPDFTSPNAAFLWEIETTVSGSFDDLGYTYSRPSIVKNHSGVNAFTYVNTEGKWVVIFGNGYASASGKAVLYIVDAQSGTLVDSVVADSAGDNGLTTVSPVDLDGDYKIDVIYAGDLKGNLWKFIPDGTATGWKVDFNGAPLFTAPSDSTGTITNVQPITMRPEVGRHPDGLPGVMVYFGTGTYFQVGDNVGDASYQSVYGIWDAWNDCFNSTSGARYSSCSSDYERTIGGIVTAAPAPTTVSPTITRTNLLKQCVTTSDGSTCETKQTTVGTGDVSTGTVGTFDVRIMSDNALSSWDWRSSYGDMGWYIDLPAYGEKQVTRHILRGGRLIFVSIIPSDHACESGGESWLMELDARTGGRLDETVFDLNGDGVFDYNDNLGGSGDDETAGSTRGVPVSGKKSKEGIIQPPSIVTSADGGKEFKYSSGSKGGVEVTTEQSGAFTRGRKSWVRIK